MDSGKHYSAAKSFDDRGRRLLWGWLREASSDSALSAAGWAGVMSLPRVLSLNQDGTLHMEPASEIQKLRLRHISRSMHYTYGHSLEIHAEFGPGGAEECGLIVRSSPDRSEETYIGYNRTRKALLLDTRKSSQSADLKKG